MTKQELLETYTAEQLTEMIIEAYEREDCPKIMAINIKGFPKMFTIKEIEEIVAAYEEIKICQEQNKQCKTILPAEFLKVLTLNKTVEEKKTEIEELKKKLERQETATKYAEEYVNTLKNELKDLEIKIEEEYKPLEIDAERLRKNERELSEESAELHSKIKKSGSVADFLPTEPIKVADMLIHNYKQGLYPVYAKDNNGQIQNIEVDGKIYPLETGEYEEYSELRQIAEHLLVYCNHNWEAEE